MVTFLDPRAGIRRSRQFGGARTRASACAEHAAAEERSDLGGYDDLCEQPMVQFGRMKHLYLLTLEIDPLEVGKVYDELPFHLTLMSRFLSEVAPEQLSSIVEPLFADTKPVNLLFGNTIELGPKKVTAHMVDSPDEKLLHKRLQTSLEEVGVTFQYPQFIGSNHKAHVTKRDGKDFPPGSQLISPVAYLIEVIDGKRTVRSRFNLDAAK